MFQLSFFEDKAPGSWLKWKNIYKCKDCGFWYLDGSRSPYNYCPKCGRYMKESEVIECPVITL